MILRNILSSKTRILFCALCFCLPSFSSAFALEADIEGSRNSSTEWLHHLAEGGSREGQMILLDQAIQGSAEAQFSLSVLFYSGVGVIQNKSESLHWLHLSAQQGHKQALNRLGQLSRNGDEEALYQLGLLLRDGKGVKKDLRKARQYFELAKTKNNLLAKFALAEMIYQGIGGELNILVAKLYYKELIRGLGMIGPSLNAGSLQSNSISQLSAEKARAMAYLCLAGAFLYSEIGIRRNVPEAISYLMEAAQWGLPEAQYELGSLFSRGIGVSLNHDLAKYWFAKAASQGLDFPNQYLTE